MDKQQRFSWLLAQSSFFSTLLQRATDSEIEALLALEKQEELPDQFQPWIPEVDSSMTMDEALAALRLAKQRGLAYFVWWELGLLGDIEVSARHLALWASGLIQAALDMAKLLIAPRFGKLEASQGQFIVIGLGKLGGYELNLGSDVDLLFVWQADDASSTTGGRNSVPAKEYYQHLSRLLIRLLDEQTVHGKTWLTDMRLRPNGDGAPICLSLQATLNHYQDHGQTWERAMLTKAAVVAGDRELGEKTLTALRPFIWRKYMDYTTVQALSEMKQRIDKQSGFHRIDSGFDVKRGPGGIREIEFMIQSLQLLHAGREPELAVSSSMPALSKLHQADHISAEHAEILRLAYRFWRRVEHAIQAHRGMHTHQLGEHWKEWLQQALEIEDIATTMQHHSAAVHQLFQHHFHNIQHHSNLNLSWMGAGAAQLLESVAAQFPDESPEQQQKMVTLLQSIQAQLHRELLPPRSLEQIEHLTFFNLKHWQGDANAVTALQAWSELLHHIGGRATWIDLLANHEQALLWLANMLASSGFIAKHISKNPTWLEWPLSHQVKGERIAAICAQISALRPKQNEEDYFLANLGRLVDEARLTTAINIASDDQLDPMLAGRWLSDVADQSVLAAMRLALFQFQLPPDFPLVALAMGKHGSQSMGLVSDLDMVFILVHDDPFALGPKNRNHREWAQRLGRRVIQHLSLKPPYGAGYEFDARLRPSGNSGVLVTTLQAFRSYQLHEAQTWEHQALCRGRPVAFSALAESEVQAVKREILSRSRGEKELKQDVKTMRRKMEKHLASTTKSIINLKQDKGGLVDIEFLAQYAQLYFHIDENQTSTVAALQHLPDHATKLWLEYAPYLVESFIIYRQMENALRVHLWASVARLPADDGAAEWETLRRHTPMKNAATLKKQMLKVRQIFNELLGQE